jgi:hypothetical protein
MVSCEIANSNVHRQKNRAIFSVIIYIKYSLNQDTKKYLKLNPITECAGCNSKSSNLRWYSRNSASSPVLPLISPFRSILSKRALFPRHLEDLPSVLLSISESGQFVGPRIEMASSRCNSWPLTPLQKTSVVVKGGSCRRTLASVQSLIL